MKFLMLCGIVVLLSSGFFTKVASGQAVESTTKCSLGEDSCDFSDYNRLKEPHALFKAAVKKVDPEYPAAARSVNASGRVVVRILVSKKGSVVKACVVEGHPLLRAASVKAAKQWKFKRNFGLTNSKLNVRFAEIELTFNFQLP